ncbi:SGNH/GDSL hydrolase family protein [Kitasatospora sp. MAP5-34]|uniref:SGNH/GDSL hydrolase family protein n=1 Tax=Kitasatospora sp. MAP5-34 TaxID=3035102 RepID=UPI00247329B0|nr:SGNH/GDSL hydrolase family protein [Kitasatospora sp. MAP5-34]MDH6574850.1 lysophospholipase L1-like esterase [Kitasatospora sp. MAP5-34]
MEVGRRRWPLGLAGLLLTAACGAGTGGLSKPAPPTGAGPTTSAVAAPSGPYVALGDSYTAGPAIDPQVGTPTGCGRSGVNYPSLVAKELGLAAGPGFADVSCSGATTADLTGVQRTAGGTNAPQLDALSPATRLVTLGIGGNDVGFVDVLTVCAMEDLRHSLFGGSTGASADQAPCRTHYTSAEGQDQLRGKVDTAGERLADLLREIGRRAPQARVYVVGYPALLPADPADCAQTLGRTVAPGDVGFLLAEERGLNAMLEQRARAAGAVYVDTFAPSVGHDMCSGKETRWIEPPIPAAGSAPVHPNARGQQGMAAAVLGAVKG